MILSLVDRERLERILRRMFDTEEFLSPFGIRSLSKSTGQVIANVGGRDASIEYEPGESRTKLFGGNSNWRGPIWFPVNVLLADKLRTLGRFYGDDLTVEVPKGSGNQINLVQAADLIDDSLVSLFRPVEGRRPADGGRIEATQDPLWQEHISFNEYFDGDTGEGQSVHSSASLGRTSSAAAITAPVTTARITSTAAGPGTTASAAIEAAETATTPTVRTVGVVRRVSGA